MQRSVAPLSLEERATAVTIQALTAFRSAVYRAREESPLRIAVRGLGERFDGVAMAVLARRTRLVLTADETLLRTRDCTWLPAFLRNTLLDDIVIESVFDIVTIHREETTC